MKVRVKETGKIEEVLTVNTSWNNFIPIDEVEFIQNETSDDRQDEMLYHASCYAEQCVRLDKIEDRHVERAFIEGAEWADAHPVKDIDWELYRRELIKAALQGFCADGNLNDLSFESISNMVIEQADAVIEKLKAE